MAERRRARLFRALCGFAAAIPVAVLLALATQLVLAAASLEPGEAFWAGLRVGAWGTVAVVLGAAVLAVPLGLGTAIYLEEYGRDPDGIARGGPGRWGRRGRQALDALVFSLAEAPSIVHGLFGLVVFVGLFGLESTLLVGALTLATMLLPKVVVATREALRAVPSEARMAGVALGARRSRMITGVVLATARRDIVAGVLRALARVTGEAVPLLMVGATAVFALPDDRSALAGLPVQAYGWILARDGLAGAAAASVLALLIVTVAIQGAALLVRRRRPSDGRG